MDEHEKAAALAAPRVPADGSRSRSRRAARPACAEGEAGREEGKKEAAAQARAAGEEALAKQAAEKAAAEKAAEKAAGKAARQQQQHQQQQQQAAMDLTTARQETQDRRCPRPAGRNVARPLAVAAPCADGHNVCIWLGGRRCDQAWTRRACAQ